MHWAAKYVGMPYEAGARGPEKVDCWGMVRLIYRNEFGIDLPEYPGISLKKPLEAARAIKDGLERCWVLTAIPNDGHLVAMSRSEDVHHIGLYAVCQGGPRILHCFNEKIVVADTLRNLKLHGVQMIKYYYHVQWLTSS